MVTILGLRAFTSVVDHQGFAAAARKMGVSRSIINKRVITLENDLGVQLLRRSTRHIGLTDTGRCFYDRSLAILNELDEAVDSVKEMQEQPRGQLRINAPMSFGTLYLSQIVAEYMQHYPQVNVELVLNDRHIDPIEEGFDITIRIGEEEIITSLISRFIMHTNRVICASPEYLATFKEPTKPRDLTRHRCLNYGYHKRGTQWRLNDDKGSYSVPINCALSSNNGEVLKNAALNHQGIAILPKFIIGDAIAKGQLTPVLTAYSLPTVSIYALYPRHRHLSAKVRLFVDFVINKLGGQSGRDWVGPI